MRTLRTTATGATSALGRCAIAMLTLILGGLAGCGRVNVSRRDASIEDARNAAGADTSIALCAADANCFGPSEVFDIGVGFERNVILGAGAQLTTAQLGIDGWWYRYEPRVRFASYDPLNAEEMDPSRFTLMENARDDEVATGWFSAGPGFGIGERGAVRRAAWDGPALGISPENGRQVVIEWRAPYAGTAELRIEVAMEARPAGDIVWDVFVRRGGTSESRVSTYLSGTPTPDANGISATVAAPESPWTFTAREALEAGESYFIVARVGDDDDSDHGTVRGTIRMIARRR